MNIEIIQQKLLEKVHIDHLRINEYMSKHTSFKIGGPADIMVLPATLEELRHALVTCKEYSIPYQIIGNGSNLLVRDKGIRGVVIKIAENFNAVKIEGNIVKAQAGILLSTLSKKIMEYALEGFEFASGIPGTLGGAVAMNAGAYGGEMKDVLRGAALMDDRGNVVYLDKDALELDYRNSIVLKKGYIVLEAEIALQPGDIKKVKEITDDLTYKRTSKQPLHLPSAGSTFKRPPGYFAGKLIEDSGLKGVRVGDAQVSDLHSGFIVNVGKATAEDVLNLVGLVQKVVRDKFGVDLHPEVRIIGEE
ncbi:UDP-N-acetylmuramate dehydrogenase [Geosporobacter subterraneus DSM 17957]|uniref:UDP-N-acetylenolpyruvoylglucosamine reductase n=1 Tax=Geosporobacter subterraneus DSM 17957 TaxID=1121919 RepID=A0A1M6JC48_9FIRM|nr:UDP-N-acetylmuramate dehydrogenase [Geosporobacter subterraneus]SHJ44192.1 UDP-N-acetylmuramate dehydrogenase [Geosporobacter subterraneus DSM 17957]